MVTTRDRGVEGEGEIEWAAVPGWRSSAILGWLKSRLPWPSPMQNMLFNFNEE
jgi:hypothetical protein